MGITRHDRRHADLDLILSRANPWQALYDPSRVTLRAASDFARENSNVALQYTDY
jgi:hypothetical protein